MTIRSIYNLAHDEIVQAAREQHDAGEPCAHGYEPGSAQAIAFVDAFEERRMELVTVEG